MKNTWAAFSKFLPLSIFLRSIVPGVFLPETAWPTTPPRAWSSWRSCLVNTHLCAGRPVSTCTSPKRNGM